MSAPHRNHANYNSPYAKPMQQYPSQSEDYVSLNVGGPGPMRQQHWSRGVGGNYRGERYSSTPAKQHFSSNRETNSEGKNSNIGDCYFYQDCRGNAPMSRGRFGHNRSHRGGGNKWRHSTNSSIPQQKIRSPGSKEEIFQLYFHPSMLEDPWKDLISRLHAIRQSEVNLQRTDKLSTVEQEQLRTESSNSDSGSENENNIEGDC